jgi:hypothetical protein
MCFKLWDLEVALHKTPRFIFICHESQLIFYPSEEFIVCYIYNFLSRCCPSGGVSLPAGQPKEKHRLKLYNVYCKLSTFTRGTFSITSCNLRETEQISKYCRISRRNRFVRLSIWVKLFGLDLPDFVKHWWVHSNSCLVKTGINTYN